MNILFLIYKLIHSIYLYRCLIIFFYIRTLFFLIIFIMEIHFIQKFRSIWKYKGQTKKGSSETKIRSKISHLIFSNKLHIIRSLCVWRRSKDELKKLTVDYIMCLNSICSYFLTVLCVVTSYPECLIFVKN